MTLMKNMLNETKRTHIERNPTATFDNPISVTYDSRLVKTFFESIKLFKF